MSQQRERPSGDDWWNRLYDGSVPDTGPGGTAAGDTLDDRFDSAADAVRHTAGDTAGSMDASTDVQEATPGEASGEASGTGQGVGPVSGTDTRAGASPGTDVDVDVDLDLDMETLAEGGMTAQRAWWEQPQPPAVPPPHFVPPLVVPPRAVPRRAERPDPRVPYLAPCGRVPVARVPVTSPGGGPPAYDPDPTALPPAHAERVDEIVADTVLDGARYGTYTLRAVSVRGDSARDRGEPRRDALLTARFGEGADALVLVAVARSTRAAIDACRWMGGAVGRSHVRLSEDIRAYRRGDLRSGLHRLTDRGLGKLRARAAELGVEPHEYTASLRCLLLSADPECRTRVFFGVGDGGLFRLRDGVWQDLEPPLPDPAAVTGEPVVGFGSPPAETPEGERVTMDPGITKPPSPAVEGPVPPPAGPFRFRASVARRGDTLLLCSTGLAEPLRAGPFPTHGPPDGPANGPADGRAAGLAGELADRWSPVDPPGLAQYLSDTQLKVKGYAADRTAVGVWEA